MAGTIAALWRDTVTLPADAVTRWRLEGGRGLWRTLADRTLVRVIRHGRLVVIAQELGRTTPVAAPAGTVVTPFDGPLDRLAPIVDRRRRDLFAQWTSEGARALVAWQDDVPVGYTWILPKMVPFLSALGLTLPAGAAYLCDLYVPPRHRSAGIGSALVSARLALAHDLGYREGWRAVAPANAPSLRTVDKTAGSGTRILGEVRFVALFGRPVFRTLPPALAR